RQRPGAGIEQERRRRIGELRSGVAGKWRRGQSTGRPAQHDLRHRVPAPAHAGRHGCRRAMKPTVSITGGDRIVQRIRELRDRLTKQNSVLVGVPKGAGNYEDGTKMAVIAAVQEYGSADGRIPERSFLRVPLSAEQRRFAET